MSRADEQVLDYSKTAKKVLQVGGWSERWAYNASNMVEYYGMSLPGRTVGSAAWSIKKYVYSGNNLTKVMWASSTAGKYTHIWSGAGAVSTTYASYNYA